MRVAAVQLNANAEEASNLATADRLTRAAAAQGASLIVLPEKWTAMGSEQELRSSAQTLEGPAIAWARETADELGVDLVAGSILETVPGQEKLANTSVHVGPDGEIKAVYRKIHMFDVEVAGRVYRESELEQAGEEIVLSRTAGGIELGLSVCYDLRFPELYRILAVRGARVITIPAAFTLATTRDHWETLVRARAIEDQVFVIAANQFGPHPAGQHSGRALDDRRPVGDRAGPGRRRRGSDRRRARSRAPARGPGEPALAGQPPPGVLRLAAGAPAGMSSGGVGTTRSKSAADKRRLILDAAVRVFARQGFHACRVSDIADEAGVAYGLVYHYFASKDEVLDTLFLERWNVMLELIRQVDSERRPVRDKLEAIASFIVDSYQHDPELMKVIIVEVTRAANSFGNTHIATIREAYDLIGGMISEAQRDGLFKPEIDAALRGDGLLRRDRAAPHGLDLRTAAAGTGGLPARQVARCRDDLRRPRVRRRRSGGARLSRTAPAGRRFRSRRHRAIDSREMENEIVKRLVWSGLLAGFGALASIAATRAAATVWRRLFDEDPPE